MIANIYKPRRKKNGRTVVSRTYRGRYRLDGQFAITEVALGTSDKQVAQRKLQDIIKDAELERAGIIAPKVQRHSAARPMSEHLADFIEDLDALGRSPVYIRLIKARNRRLFQDCGWHFAKDITSDQFIAWRAQQEDLSAKTLNEYLNAASALLNWMVKQERIVANPLIHVSKVNLKGQQQRRRALTDEELQKLLGASGARRLLYLTASYTGLRQNELRQLCWGDVHLSAEKPFIKARASTTKNGREAIIPVHPELAEELADIMPKKATEDTPVFDIGSNPTRIFLRDLDKAGITRIDGLNRKVDFHSLRYTFCTMLAKHGTSQRMAQELMRHSDPHLTAQIYTDVTQLPTFDAVSALPWQSENSPQAPQIDPQKSDFSGQILSSLGTKMSNSAKMQATENEKDRPELSPSVTLRQMAEREGFEPSEPFGSMVFKTTAFGHSAISPFL